MLPFPQPVTCEERAAGRATKLGQAGRTKKKRPWENTERGTRETQGEELGEGRSRARSPRDQRQTLSPGL